MGYKSIMRTDEASKKYQIHHTLPTNMDFIYPYLFIPSLGKPQKMAVPINALTPPPPSLMAVRTFSKKNLKVLSLKSLNDTAMKQ